MRLPCAYVARSVISYFHHASTYRIGDGDDAVVDSELRVSEVTGLRVADVSMWPPLPSANTNATVVAVAERAAELLGEA